MPSDGRYGTLPEPQFGEYFVTAFVYTLAAGMFAMWVFGL